MVSMEYALSSIYRSRSFRSVSPVQRLQQNVSALTERSVSCPRVKRDHSVVDESGKSQARTLCFSKEYYANKPQDNSDEVQWREKSPARHEDRENSTFSKRPDPAQFETLEQYELEAARPRTSKSQDLIKAFESKTKDFNRYVHLQPNQIKPYGSGENFYSPILLRPTNSLKFRKKSKKSPAQEAYNREDHTTVNSNADLLHRTYSTSTNIATTEDMRNLSTTKSCIAKEGHSSKDKSFSDIGSIPKEDYINYVKSHPKKLNTYLAKDAYKYKDNNIADLPQKSNSMAAHLTKEDTWNPSRSKSGTAKTSQAKINILNEDFDNFVKHRRKAKISLAKEAYNHRSSNNADLPNNNYSTQTILNTEDVRGQSKNRSNTIQISDSTKEKNSNITKDNSGEDYRIASLSKLGTQKLSQIPVPFLNCFEEHWAVQGKHLAISPPRFRASTHEDDYEDKYTDLRMETSDQAKRRQRKEENQKGSAVFKSSFSDLIKLKLKDREANKLELSKDLGSSASNDHINVFPLTQKSGKKNKMLDVFQILPGRRSLTTRSKSNIFKNDALKRVNSLQSPEHALNNPNNQRNTSSKKLQFKHKGSEAKQEYNPKCETVCSPIQKSLKRSKAPRFAYEPTPCRNAAQESQKVYLPSTVKLPVHPCLQRPPYRDCKIDDHCGPRADECLEIKPKKLPKLGVNDCPCIDGESPTLTPKLEKLEFKFEDPPRVICHPPPCQTPRADDKYPYKFKPLRPYVPPDCSCIDQPPMKDVKVKRLPRCEPDDICRPPRICPIINPCPPRADECLKIEPKKLPSLKDTRCPCVEPPAPTVAPLIPRLDLDVPEPERNCHRPIPCPEKPRADDCCKPKKKKLPRFTPGDCPCTDKPMVDWNLRRLVCEDEPNDCIVPDPCLKFARADWGCWEYPDEVCDEVDDKCVDHTQRCPKPPKPQPKDCRKKNPCEHGGITNFRSIPKRDYSHSSIGPLKLHQRNKNSIICKKQTNGNSVNNSKDNCSDKQASTTIEPTESKILKKPKTNIRKQASASAILLIKELNKLDNSTKSKEPLLFQQERNEKVDYQNILKCIAKTSAQILEKKEPTNSITLKKPKHRTVTVASRAISTTEQLSMDESTIRKEKDCKVKEKCKNIRPSIQAQICKKACPRMRVCPNPETLRNPACKKERVPVCCEKEQSPHLSYSEKFPYVIPPFTTSTPQWQCNNRQFGFHPVYKKEHDPLDIEKKKNIKKSYSTCSLIGNLPLYTSLKESECTVQEHSQTVTAKTNFHKPTQQTSCLLTIKELKPGAFLPPSKGVLRRNTSMSNLLSTSNRNVTNLLYNQSRQFATRIFEIYSPEPCPKPKVNKCGDSLFKKKIPVPKITCQKQDDCKPAETRFACKREFSDPTAFRKKPPFPAFSDCLDEEMEAILTECPLDKEKFLRMQPRYMDPTPKGRLKPPPPHQGKIDVLKEQQCLRDKFDMNFEGVTQTCLDFGEPVALKNTKEVVKEENMDCKRMEELKRMGRWPPFTLKSNRRFFSTSTTSNIRTYSTLGTSNLIYYMVRKSFNHSKVKRVYIRNFHALTKDSDKAVLADNEERLKEITQKIFPNMDETTKLLKLKNNHWRIQNLKMYDQLNRHSNIAQRVKRYYTTYKIRRRNACRNETRRCTKESPEKRCFSGCTILTSKPIYFRGRRFLNRSRPKQTTTTSKERCKIKTTKKECPKFTLRNCPETFKRPKCQKIYDIDCAKPFSPYPAYSECKEHELIEPSCECAYHVSRMEDLQPRLAARFNDPSRQSIKEYPSQEKIDFSLGSEYCKCKYGIENTGKTVGCGTFSESDASNSKPYSFNDLMNCQEIQQESCNNFCEHIGQTEGVELIVQDHLEQEPKAKTKRPCCQNAADSCDIDRNKLEEICISECVKSFPCCLPEEEIFCICKEKCKHIFKENKAIACRNPCENQEKSSQESPSQEKQCPEPATVKEDQCCPQIMAEKDPCNHETCKVQEDQGCKQVEAKEEPCSKPPKVKEKPIYRKNKKDCASQRKTKLKDVECLEIPENEPYELKASKLNQTKENEGSGCPPEILTTTCKDVMVNDSPCTEKNRSFTQLEALWQRVVNYFKARPNCPQPGDYKKKVLKEKAQKAASAAGLVAIDPNCLPPDVRNSFKATKKDCCKVCPNQDPCDKKKSPRSATPPPRKRNFSTIYQPSRNYSRSMSCKNLEEINKILEEEEIKQKMNGSNRNFKNDFYVFAERKTVDSSKALKMSLDLALDKPAELSDLCDKNGRTSRTYFGYSDIIPSRENILERAWRVSIEAYNKHNCPRTYTFFNEFFARMENSIKTVEDLEKLKTENVLRELEKFLKTEDPDADKKKK